MAHDRRQIEQLARDYTEAWCSRDPARVASHYAPGGTIAINGGEPAPIADVTQAFIDAFPDIEVFQDDLVVVDDVVEYHWTFTGTSAETGKPVRIGVRGLDDRRGRPHRLVARPLRRGRVRAPAS